ncbi:MAG: hypothetical protein MOGMAGMI_02445 [Candidatus Omnitrophica bacterium]|nr:hypothetical protein [Candidatus Omnitrophota bacterium]
MEPFRWTGLGWLWGQIERVIFPHRDPSSPWQKRHSKSGGNGKRHTPLRKTKRGRMYLSRQRKQRRHERTLAG